MTEPVESGPQAELPRAALSRRRFLPEAGCVLLVAVLAGLFAYQAALLPFGDKLEERTKVVLFAFRAPSMFALGHGMRDAAMKEIPALDAFYRGETASVDTSKLPDDIFVWPVRDSYQYMHYNLLYAIGWTWRVLGISTWSIQVLCSVLYAALMAVLYGLFRQAMGRVMSVLMVFFLCTSPAYLISCPSLRDFGKAPFMLGFFLIGAVLLRRRQSGPSLVAWAVAAGAVAGVGYGFRQDLLTCLPAAMLLLLFFSRVSAAHPLRWRALAVLCTLLTFGLAGWAPIYGTLMDHGSASAQALVQGASETAESRMDFGNASYVMHYGYADVFDFTIVNAFARRQGDHTPMPGHFSAEHGRMGKKWFREEALEYPADVFSRGIASALMLPKISALSLKELYAFDIPDQASIGRFVPLHRALSDHFSAWGLCYVLAGLMLFAFYDLRAAAGTALLLVYFAALPGLLFEFRHFFHLAFVPYWIAAALLAWAGRGLWRIIRRKRPVSGRIAGAGVPRRLAGALLLPLVLVSGLALTLVVLWQVQALSMSRTLSRYEQAKLEPVTVHEELRGAEILLRPDAALPGLAATETLPPFETCGEYLALEMDYNGKPIPLRVLYECPDIVDFTHTMQPHIDYPGHPCRVRFFFPVYQTVWGSDSGGTRGKFAGIGVPPAQRPAIHGLYRVVNGKDFALWPYITVPEERGAFVGRKSGPHDRAVANLGNFFRSQFAEDPRVRVAAEIALAKSYPGYVPRLTDAASTEEQAYERWRQALQSVPVLTPQAVADLSRFLPGPSVPDPAAELRVQQHIAALSPENHTAATRAARLLIDLGDPAAAGERAQAVLMRSPESAFAARTLDEALAAMNASEKRLTTWRELHAAKPASVTVAAHLTLALWDAGEVDEGLRTLEGMPPNPDIEPEALLDLGRALATYGRTEQGMAQVDRALGTAAWLSEMAVNSCTGAAEARSKAGDSAAAITLYAKARALGPKNVILGVRLGELREAAGDDSGALAEFQSVVAGTPDARYSAQRMDALYARLNDQAGRLQAWQKLVETHPGAAIPRLHLGLALEASGDAAGAEAAYRQALAIDKSLVADSPLFDRIKNEAPAKP